MSNAVTEALKVLRDDLQHQVKDLMGELTTFSQELSDLQLGDLQPTHATNEKATRATRSARKFVP
jgi:hypothetical protein